MWPFKSFVPSCPNSIPRKHPHSVVRILMILFFGWGLGHWTGCALAPSQSREQKATSLNRIILEKKPPSKESEIYYHLILGEMYSQGNQNWLAAGELEKALAVEPHDPSLMLESAQLYYKMMEIEKALDLIQKAIKQDPKSKEAFQLLGEIQI
ncbi:MAG: tetratricopeptide repeat protein, partial [Desulfobacteraceae bacterium]